MKRRNIMIGLGLFAVGLIIVGAVLTVTSKTNKTIDKDKNNSKTYTDLFEVANDMYENESYLDLPKNNKGIYYMTIGEYKKRGYTLDLIDTTCQDTFGFIYFDVENKDMYEKAPVYIFDTCEIIPSDSSNS